VRLGFIFLGVGVPGILITILKQVIGRARPFANHTGTLLFVPFSWGWDYTSFPSGDASNAFAAAIVIGALWPRARFFMWVYAGLIAIGRVVVGAHYPSDVIAGSVVGSFGAILVRDWFAARRLGFCIDPDGRVRALRGPSLRHLKAIIRRAAQF
jgi:undecaprenyl-diphosphatase